MYGNAGFEYRSVSPINQQHYHGTDILFFYIPVFCEY